MALIKDEKVYRNLQEQVYENTCDIKELLRMYGYHGPYTSTDIIPIDDLYNRAMYLIGTGMPYKVYQYSDITKRFTYIGDYNMDVGPEGPPGPPGPRGERGPDGRPASQILNIETYDIVYKPTLTESKVRANFDDGHSNEFTVFAKNGLWDSSNLIPGKGITVDYKFEDATAVVGVDDTIIDTDKLNEELLKKQDVLIPGDNITIVDNVISSVGGTGAGEMPYIELLKGWQRNGDYALWLQAILAGGFRSNFRTRLPKGAFFGPDLPENSFEQQYATFELLSVKHNDQSVATKEALETPGIVHAIFRKLKGVELFEYKDSSDLTSKLYSETLDTYVAVILDNYTYDFLEDWQKFKKAEYNSWGYQGPKFPTKLITDDLAKTLEIVREEAIAAETGLIGHTIRTDLHTTQAEKDAWNAKLDTADLADYAKTKDVNKAVSDVTNALNAEILERGNEIARVEGKIPDVSKLATKDSVTAVANDLSNHTSNGTIHVTASDKVAWSNKVNQEQIADMATKTDLEDYVTSDIFNTTISSIDDELVAIRNDIPDVSEFVTGTQMGNYVAQELVPVSNRIGDVESNVDTLIAFAQDVPNTYAKKSDIPDVSDFAKKSDIPDVSDFAKKSDIPDVSGKVDKITTTDTYARVYGITQGGAQSNYPITSAAVANTIVSRTNDGHILAADPTANNHVTNKKYVDDAIAAIPAPTDCVDLTTDQDIFGKKAFKEPYKLVEVAPPTPVGGNLYQGLEGFSGAGVVVLNSYMTINLAGSSAWRSGVDLSIVDTTGEIHNTKAEVRLYGSNLVPDSQETVIISSAGVQEIWLYVRSSSASSARALWVQDGATSSKVNTGRTVGNYPTADGLQYEPVKLTRGTDYNSNGQVIIGFGGNLDVYAIEIVFAGSSQARASEATYEYKELATLDDIPDLTNYAKKSDIPDITGLATKSELTAYAKRDDIPDVSNMVTTNSAQTITGHKIFDEGSVDIAQSGNKSKAIRLYGTGSIGIYDIGTEDIRTAYLTLPRTTGTLALTSDIPTVPTDYVKLTGDQTISGDKTFTQGLIAEADIYVDDTSTGKYVRLGAGHIHYYDGVNPTPREYTMPSGSGQLAILDNIPHYYQHHITLSRTDDTKYVVNLDIVSTSSTVMDYIGVVAWMITNAPSEDKAIGCTGMRLDANGSIIQIPIAAYKYETGNYVRVKWYNPQTGGTSAVNVNTVVSASVHAI